MERVSICTRICFALQEFCMAKVEILAAYDLLD